MNFAQLLPAVCSLREDTILVMCLSPLTSQAFHDDVSIIEVLNRAAC